MLAQLIKKATGQDGETAESTPSLFLLGFGAGLLYGVFAVFKFLVAAVGGLFVVREIDQQFGKAQGFPRGPRGQLFCNARRAARPPSSWRKRCGASLANLQTCWRSVNAEEFPLLWAGSGICVVRREGSRWSGSTTRQPGSPPPWA